MAALMRPRDTPAAAPATRDGPSSAPRAGGAQRLQDRGQSHTLQPLQVRASTSQPQARVGTDTRRFADLDLVSEQCRCGESPAVAPGPAKSMARHCVRATRMHVHHE
eukprot:7316102-Prymnesium_polylepis.1